MGALPLLVREAERVRVRRRPTRVGDVDVDRAERGLDVVEQSRDRVQVVGVEHEALCAELARGGVDRFAIAGRDRDLRTLGRKRPRDSEADPLRAARDERDAPLETEIHQAAPFMARDDRTCSSLAERARAPSPALEPPLDLADVATRGRVPRPPENQAPTEPHRSPPAACGRVTRSLAREDASAAEQRATPRRNIRPACMGGALASITPGG